MSIRILGIIYILAFGIIIVQLSKIANAKVVGDNYSAESGAARDQHAKSSQEIEALQTDINSKEKAAVKTVLAYTPPPAAVQEAAYLEGMWWNPEYKSQSRVAVRGEIFSVYSDFIKNLPHGEKDKLALIPLLAERALIFNYDRRYLQLLRDRRPASAEEKKRNDSEIASILGGDSTNILNEYDRTILARAALAPLRKHLAIIGKPLSEQQLSAAIEARHSNPNVKLSQILEAGGQLDPAHKLEIEKFEKVEDLRASMQTLATRR